MPNQQLTEAEIDQLIDQGAAIIDKHIIAARERLARELRTNNRSPELLEHEGDVYCAVALLYRCLEQCWRDYPHRVGSFQNMAAHYGLRLLMFVEAQAKRN